MRKIYTAAIVIICLIVTMNIVFADSSREIRMEYEDEGITVIFDGSSSDDELLCIKIADRIVYGVNENENDNDNDNEVEPMSLCWLFGHDITTSSVTVITHKAKTYSPRCLKELYHVQTCSKCDYYKEECLSAVYIVCHPND